MDRRTKLIKTFEVEIRLALEHLLYSQNKSKSLSTDPRNLNFDQLEVWESFSARFSRLTDIFLSKYLRLYILNEDPGFRGTFRDFIDLAEKIGLVSSANQWMEVRELRNKMTHEYTRDDLKLVFDDVLRYTPFVVEEISRIFP